MKESVLKKFSRTLLLAVFLITGSWAVAQQLTVQGTVVGSDDQAGIPGVNVYVKGTTEGTVTDLDGKFTIEVEKDVTLVFSYVGYIQEEVLVNVSNSSLNISLDPDLVSMEEIIVVGYGTQKKSDLSGAVVSVEADELSRKPVATVEQALQGLAAGVSVTGNSGAPGEGAKVVIRGLGTVNNADPLYVIDGVPVGGPGSTNPADIESISILKDAASCAIYGSRGANGVVMITTKSGKKGLHVNFDAKFGVQKESKRLDLLNSQQYAEYINEAHYNKYQFDGRRFNPPLIAADPTNQPINTDWQEEMFRTAPMQQYNLSVSGANEWGKYSVSGGYFDQDGIMISTGFKKYYARVNSEAKWKMFRVGQNIAFNYSDKDNEKNMVGGRTQLERTLKMTSNIPVYNEDEVGGYAGPTSIHGHDAVNPVGVANMYTNRTYQKGITGSLFAEAEIIDGLTYTFTYGFDFWNRKLNEVTPINTMGTSHSSNQRIEDTTYTINQYNLFQNILNYDKEFGLHKITLLAGYSAESNRYDRWKNNVTYNQDNDSTSYTPGPRTNLYESSMISSFGRINYSYADKYLLQANIRRDGSSRFGANNKWGVFPSYSAAWVVSKEGFMSNIPVISFFKLRGSYGTIGNEKIDDYATMATLGVYQRYVFNDVTYDGTGPDGLSAPNLQWETSIMKNVGVDFGFFANRLNITAEYYVNTTEDMLLKVTLPTTSGVQNNPWQNTGSVRNKGFEFMLNYRKSEGAFNYSVTANFSTVDNEVLKLGTSGEPLYGGQIEGTANATKTVIGGEIGEFYGYETDGIYGSDDVIDTEFAPFAKVGDIRFKDQNNDGILDDDDKVALGSPIPDFTYGLNLSASYKGIDMSLTLQGVYGNEILRETVIWTEGMNTNFNTSTDVLNRYRASDITITTEDGDGNTFNTDYTANTATNMPIAYNTDNNGNITKFSDRYIEDGSYLRLKDLSIGYSFPASFNEKIKVNSFRIYFTGLNLLTFTDYKGYDPEIGSNTSLPTESSKTLARGIDYGYYPQAKAYLFGIQLGF